MNAFKIPYSSIPFQLPAPNFYILTVMVIKYPILVLLFFIVALLQNSFLPYISIAGIWPNLVFILFFLVTFFQPNDILRPTLLAWLSFDGIFFALTAGTLLDIFLPFSFGYATIFLLLMYIAIRICMHILSEHQEVYPFIYFILLFLAAGACYYLYMQILVRLIIGSSGSGITDFDIALVIDMVYNASVATIGFFIYKAVIPQKALDRQLTLFR